MKTAAQIRQEFIDFFVSKYNHTQVPSAPVVPLDDPTLLFTNAGMNQFKDVFLGTGERPYTRAVDSQKVIRASGKHNDLDDVGYDTYHHTFFEMLGNWSFADYGKSEAITWAWELLTDVWGLDKTRLYATVFRDDSDAFKIWKNETDIHTDHILYFDEKDNFWEMGATGPCGPCSEIHYDRIGLDDVHGSNRELGVNAGNERFIEIWNLVFIQNFRNEAGELEDLGKLHVDTGMGFERIVAVLQDVPSNYDTDVFKPLLDEMATLSGKSYSPETEVSFRVAVDHIRAIAFSIADGALPSNEGRGYVLRRMLRRAARYGRTIGLTDPYLYKLTAPLVTQMKTVYPELATAQTLIEKTIKSEEEQFNRTLDTGLSLFEELKDQIIGDQQSEIPGEDAFKLYDTYGFPLDLTQILASEHGLHVDVEGFERSMNAQRERARAAGNFTMATTDSRDWTTLTEGDHSHFVGYERLQSHSEIRKFSMDDEHLYLILSVTPFYAESGGQVGDRGTIGNYQVSDVQHDGDAIVHICNFVATAPTEASVIATVNDSERRSTANNHTATHLMHQALKEVLGDHVKQAGSLVDSNRLRFDFNHFEKVTDEQLREIEAIVNREILANTVLKVQEIPYDQAIEAGAVAMFGEKYGDVVRTVKVGDFSFELCGGTHVAATGQIGSFQIVQETSVASGVRRIEAITGQASVRKMQTERHQLSEINQLLNTAPNETIDKLNQMLLQRKSLEKELAALREKTAILEAKSWKNEIDYFNNYRILVKRLHGIDGKTLKTIGGDLIQNEENALIALISENDGKVALTVAVSPDLTPSFHAGKLVGEMAKICGGGGGGRPDLASAGGRDASKIENAIHWLKEQIK